MGVAEYETYSYSGPLPDPAILQRYEEIVPGSARDIIEEFKSEGAHRRAIERRLVESQIAQANRGQIFALALGLLGIGGGIGLLFLGKSLAGLAVVIGSVASLMGVFLINKRRAVTKTAPRDEAPE